MDMLTRRFVASSAALLLLGSFGCGDDTGGGGGGGSGSGGASSSTSDSSSDATTDASSSTGEAGTCTLDPATDPECAELVSSGVTYETGYVCTGDAEPACDGSFAIGNDRWCCPPA